MYMCLYISPLIFIITAQSFLPEDWHQNRQWDSQYHVKSGSCLAKSIKFQTSGTEQDPEV